VRRRLVVGNWKMNPATLVEAVDLAVRVGAGSGGLESEIVICPPFLWLTAVAAAAGEQVAIGAQTARPEPRGAFTGEVAMSMLEGLARFVIVGHSERRALGETDADVAARTVAALDLGLIPIVAVGESAAERAAGQTESVVTRQLGAALEGLGLRRPNLVVAYEPIWAIGSGTPATAADAQAAARALRELLGTQGIGDATRILYGGSVTATSAGAFFDQPDIDGALVGGASLDPEAFLAIARVAG
jgi:triosephosphate isomerase